MFCPKCGKKVDDIDKFCLHCGNFLDNDTTSKNAINSDIQKSDDFKADVKNVMYQGMNIQGARYQENNTPEVNNQKVNYQAGNYQQLNNQMINYQAGNYQQTNNQNYIQPQKKKSILAGVGIGILVIIGLVVASGAIFNSDATDYYLTDDVYGTESETSTSQTDITDEVIVIRGSEASSKKRKYSTVIVTDNVYSNVKITNDSDAYGLIMEDSTSQKSTTSAEMKKIEDEIISYGIVAANLCELDIQFAREIANVVKMVYTEYPSVRNYLTNLTLENCSMNESYIAAFYPVFNFASSNTVSTYPWVIKTQIKLNTSYFLNIPRIEAAVKDSSSAGHFPPNANRYSSVAHEFGHYLSFMALLKNRNTSSILLVDESNIDNFYDVYDTFQDDSFSHEMIKEAYDNYQRDVGTTLEFDEWRATISQYAVAKDNSGNYIYDETIAEGFHDVYLNKENAKDASKYVVSVLKSKLEAR